MLLNDLPDDCLWLIFDIFSGLEDLIRLSQVCSKWSNLVSIRFKRVKCLVTSEPIDHINNSKICTRDPIDTLKHHNLRELLPNLRIVTVVDFLHRYQLKPRHFKKVINNNPKIKGDELYNGPNLSKLKILEAYVSGWDGAGDEFNLIDYCTSLESAFICSSTYEQSIDISIKNYNLRDLVIEIPLVGHMNWSSIRKLLTKFPNLFHLAIRGSLDVADCHVEELVQLLPQIKLLDFRESDGVTVKSADFLSKFCLKSDRSIKIYYDCEKEPNDWPKYDMSRESIVYGFDFMKHCFYKSFSRLPFLIDE